MFWTLCFGLTSWLLFVMFSCNFVTSPCGTLGQVWYLIVSIPDICPLSSLECKAITIEAYVANSSVIEAILSTLRINVLELLWPQ